MALTELDVGPREKTLLVLKPDGAGKATTIGCKAVYSSKLVLNGFVTEYTLRFLVRRY